jgi:hypothetical protein
MLNVYAECRYAECHYADCHGSSDHVLQKEFPALRSTINHKFQNFQKTILLLVQIF